METGEIVAWALAAAGLGLGAFIYYDMSSRERSGVSQALARCGLKQFWYTDDILRAVNEFTSIGNEKGRTVSHCYTGTFKNLETYICTVTGENELNPRSQKSQIVILHIAQPPIPDLTIYKNDLGDQLVHRLHALNFVTRLDHYSFLSSIDDQAFTQNIEQVARNIIKPGCEGVEVRNNRIMYFGNVEDEQFKSHYLQATLESRAQTTAQLLSAAREYDARRKRHEYFYGQAE